MKLARARAEIKLFPDNRIELANKPKSGGEREMEKGRRNTKVSRVKERKSERGETSRPAERERERNEENETAESLRVKYSSLARG